MTCRKPPRPNRAAGQETTTKALSAPDEAQEASPRRFAESELGLQEPPFRPTRSRSVTLRLSLLSFQCRISSSQHCPGHS